LKEAFARGVTHLVCGDILYPEHKRWVERMCGEANLEVVDQQTTFRAPSSDQRIIDFDLRLTARTAVTFADNHDAILGLRLGTEFEEAVWRRGHQRRGLTGWQRLRGTRSAWVDWRATVDGEDVGVAVMDAPTNFRFPTPWHLRDYTLLFASPFAFRGYNPIGKGRQPDAETGYRPDAALSHRFWHRSPASSMPICRDRFSFR
jgi:Methane oxygenase PmoA